MQVFFYSVQPLKGQLGFEEIDADLEARNMPQERKVIPSQCSMFWRARQRNIISALVGNWPL